jgi:hypothetical protein
MTVSERPTFLTRLIPTLLLLSAQHAEGVLIEIAGGTGQPGDHVTVDVILHSEGESVAGVQNDIIFDPAFADLAKGSDCKINPAIGDRLEECEDDPPASTCKALQWNLADCPEAAGCPGGSEGLRRFRGIILSTANLSSIPDGVLYSCTFTIWAAPSDPAACRLSCDNVGASTPGGDALVTECVDGEIGAVAGSPLPTRTPTPTLPRRTPTFTATPRPRTRTPTPRQPTATPLPGPAGGWCEHGDQCLPGLFCVDRVCCRVESCPEGERCDVFGFEGECHETLSPGKLCEDNSDCVTGWCVDGACCRVETCPEGNMCSPPDGFCMEPPTPAPTQTGQGVDCEVDRDCEPGLVCVNGVCCNEHCKPGYFCSAENGGVCTRGTPPPARTPTPTGSASIQPIGGPCANAGDHSGCAISRGTGGDAGGLLLLLLGVTLWLFRRLRNCGVRSDEYDEPKDRRR